MLRKLLINLRTKYTEDDLTRKELYDLITKLGPDIKMDWENSDFLYAKIENLETLDVNESPEVHCPNHFINTEFGEVYLSYAGGDWEYPVAFFIFEHGGKLFRYIPTYGNLFNAQEERAFGNSDTDDLWFIENENHPISDYIRNNKELGEIRGKVYECGYDISEIIEDIPINVKAMVKDLEAYRVSMNLIP